MHNAHHSAGNRERIRPSTDLYNPWEYPNVTPIREVLSNLQTDLLKSLRELVRRVMIAKNSLKETNMLPNVNRALHAINTFGN